MTWMLIKFSWMVLLSFCFEKNVLIYNKKTTTIHNNMIIGLI